MKIKGLKISQSSTSVGYVVIGLVVYFLFIINQFLRLGGCVDCCVVFLYTTFLGYVGVRLVVYFFCNHFLSLYGCKSCGTVFLCAILRYTFLRIPLLKLCGCKVCGTIFYCCLLRLCGCKVCGILFILVFIFINQFLTL